MGPRRFAPLPLQAVRHLLTFGAALLPTQPPPHTRPFFFAEQRWLLRRSLDPCLSLIYVGNALNGPMNTSDVTLRELADKCSPGICGCLFQLLMCACFILRRLAYYLHVPLGPSQAVYDPDQGPRRSVLFRGWVDGLCYCDLRSAAEGGGAALTARGGHPWSWRRTPRCARSCSGRPTGCTATQGPGTTGGAWAEGSGGRLSADHASQHEAGCEWHGVFSIGGPVERCGCNRWGLLSVGVLCPRPWIRNSNRRKWILHTVTSDPPTPSSPFTSQRLAPPSLAWTAPPCSGPVCRGPDGGEAGTECGQVQGAGQQGTPAPRTLAAH